MLTTLPARCLNDDDGRKVIVKHKNEGQILHIVTFRRRPCPERCGENAHIQES